MFIFRQQRTKRDFQYCMLMGFELFMDVLRPTNAIKHRRKMFNKIIVVEHQTGGEEGNRKDAKGKQLK
jgi:hypothetical protein